MIIDELNSRLLAKFSMKLHLLFLLFITLLSSCHTGIESTKKIELTRDDRRQLRSTPEEELLADVRPQQLSGWSVGKKFFVSDPKALMVFDPAGIPEGFKSDSIVGKYIEYAGCESYPTAGGVDECVVLFSLGDIKLRYRTGKSMKDAPAILSSVDIPMLVDMDMVQGMAELLTGRDLWIRTPIWYDSDGERINGRKFVKVHIDEVTPGTMLFPIRLRFTDDTGAEAYAFMNYGTRSMESRVFPTLFSLTDVRKEYPSVRDEMWEFIQNGRICPGMTKLECKLSLGNPKEVNSGHDWNNTLDIWQYGDGIFLRFRDGLLVDYRR